MAPPRERRPQSLGSASCIRETDKAILVELEGEERWIPKSVIHADSEVWTVHSPNDEGDLVVDEWWASQQDWT